MNVSEVITAWATLAIAVATLVSVWIAYRAFRGQAENFKSQAASFARSAASFASSVSADLALKLLNEFDGESSLARRSRVARACLDDVRIAEIEDIFDFFELVGLFTRKGLIDVDVAHSFFFHWVNLYWLVGKETVQERQRESEGLWRDFESLHSRLLQIETETSPRSRAINPSVEYIRKSLEEELI